MSMRNQTADGQLVSASLRKTTVICLIVLSFSAVTLIDMLVVQESLLKYIVTYKMSQYHMELFFRAVRSRGGETITRQLSTLKLLGRDG